MYMHALLGPRLDGCVTAAAPLLLLDSVPCLRLGLPYPHPFTPPLACVCRKLMGTRAVIGAAHCELFVLQIAHVICSGAGGHKQLRQSVSLAEGASWLEGGGGGLLSRRGRLNVAVSGPFTCKAPDAPRHHLIINVKEARVAADAATISRMGREQTLSQKTDRQRSLYPTSPREVPSIQRYFLLLAPPIHVVGLPICPARLNLTCHRLCAICLMNLGLDGLRPPRPERQLACFRKAAVHIGP